MRELVQTGSVEADKMPAGLIYSNDKYVVIRRVLKRLDDGGRFIHLSIRRQDRGAAHDWRDFQEIKNQLVGKEAEGLELYPAESRLVDTANQFHIWAWTNQSLPFGFNQRLVSDNDEAKKHGSAQRDQGEPA